MTEARLAEVPEAEATGRIAEIYADVRRVLGLPMVNLVYRHLATRPELLEEVWAGLRPNLASAAAAAAASELASTTAAARVEPIPRAALAAAGFTPEDAVLAAATLRAYARANSRNILAMHALLAGCPGTGEGAGPADPPSAEPILPMADLATLAAPAAALLEEMSLEIAGPAEPRIVPSLLRHFAANTCLLALVWTAVRPAVATGAVAAQAEALAERARALAGELPYPVTVLAEAEPRRVAERFVGAMSQMLVLGVLIGAALREAL